jgi:hypothetical protein
MKKLFVLLFFAVCPAFGQSPHAAWVQYGPGGALEVRVVAEATCPALEADGVATPMQVRAAADGNFPNVCAAAVPAGVRTLAVGGMALPLPVFDPARILIVGDGGCRVKGGLVQDCRDENAWPFARVAAAAAKLKPDLILHVGDYPSREQVCPAGNALCQGQPFGDNWTVWNADFFAPAAPLFSVAPIVFSRGNHEECRRSGAGFLRLLGPYPFEASAPCAIHQMPFRVPFDRFDLTVLDDAAAPEMAEDATLVPAFRDELAALDNSSKPVWLMLHRPVFGVVDGPLGIKAGGNRTLIAALPDGGVNADLSISGHIHAFEALNYAGGRKRMPPQLIAGLGGDLLSDVPDDPQGAILQGMSGVEVASAVAAREHGFVLMSREKTGWRIERFDPDGVLKQTCAFAAGKLGCP